MDQLYEEYVGIHLKSKKLLIPQTGDNTKEETNEKSQ